MRIMADAAAAAFQSGAAATAILVTMTFDSGVLTLNTSRYNVTDENESPPVTYYGTGILGKIGAVTDENKNITAVELELSGVDPAVIAIALGEQCRGKPVLIELGIFDAKTHQLLDISRIWAGQMSTMQLSQQGNTASIKLSCEHRGVLFARPKAIRYTDADQQRDYPGDRCLEYIVSQSVTQDIWPAAGFFKQ